jgi:hypothetical protein
MTRLLATMLAIAATGGLGPATHGRLGQLRTVSDATGYCYGQITAMGTTVPSRDGHGVIAVRGRLAWLYRRWIRIEGPPSTLRALHGRRWYRAEDRFGSGSVMDGFVPWGGEPDCAFGRRVVRFRVAFR